MHKNLQIPHPTKPLSSIMFKWSYQTPAGFNNITMSSDGEFLTGLWFDGSSDARKHVSNYQEKYLPIFRETCDWLDTYFAGKEPGFTPKYKINNLTSFRKEVQEIMVKIPFGKTVSYGEIAKTIAENHGMPKMSARAVGGAVGWNPICLIIPCHRVVGANGSLTGYGGGIKNKIALFKLEDIDLADYIIPTKGTKL